MRKLVIVLLVSLVLTIAGSLVTQNVSAQVACSNPLVACGKITNITAPTTIGVGQPLTVTVTVSYTVNGNAGQGVVIAILNRTENGKPFSATAVTPSSCSQPSSQAVCFVDVGAPSPSNSVLFCCQGTSTASFTLTASNQPETLNLCVFAFVTQLNLDSPSSSPTILTSNFKIVPVTVTP